MRRSGAAARPDPPGRFASHHPAVRALCRQALLWGVRVLQVWAAVLDATGGFVLAVAGVRVSSRSSMRPLVAALVQFAIGADAFGRRALDAEIDGLISGFRRMAPIRISAPRSDPGATP